MIDSIRDIIWRESQAILNIPVGDEYEKAVELIVRQVHELKGKLITSGMGKAGQIAMNIATTFSSTGTPSVFLHPSEAQHGDLAFSRSMTCSFWFPIRVRPAKYWNWQT